MRYLLPLLLLTTTGCYLTEGRQCPVYEPCRPPSCPIINYPLPYPVITVTPKSCLPNSSTSTPDPTSSTGGITIINNQTCTVAPLPTSSATPSPTPSSPTNLTPSPTPSESVTTVIYCNVYYGIKYKKKFYAKHYRDAWDYLVPGTYYTPTGCRFTVNNDGDND